MTQLATRQSCKIHAGRRFCALLLLAVLAYLVSLGIKIDRAASVQQLRHAQAIIVFGAAEYSGHPSPVYRARLDHAYELFQQRLAPVVITTGGAGTDPSFSEGQVGHDYLLHRGIPESSLIAETQGSDTAQSAARVATIMRANHMTSCLAVSDAYHVFRIGRLMAHEGIEVYLAPRPDSRPHSVFQRALAILREALSFTLWQLHITR